MDFSESPRIAAIRGTVREFVRSELLPLESVLLRDGFAAVESALEEQRARARQTGLWAAPLPEEHGGAGLPLTEFAHVSEELGWSPIGHYCFNCQAPDLDNMGLLLEFGTAGQRDRFLAPLVQGAIRSCFTMTGLEYTGSNPSWPGTTAVRDDDVWVVRSQECSASSVDGAAFAICLAVTDPNAEPRRRASMFVVPTDTPGFELVGNLSVMGRRGHGWASHGEVRYQNARLPAENMLGQQGHGFALAQRRLAYACIHHGSRWIGICERALDILCRHAVSRELAPGVKLGTRQLVQHWVAESRAEIHAARLMVLHAAWKVEQAGAPAARDEISLVKLTVARTVLRVLDRAIQALGGAGMTDDGPLAYWYAHERAARLLDGADEDHLESVARRALRAYGLEQ